MVSNCIVHSLWIGDSLSLMEQLCIYSYLANRHEFHLYTYSEIENIPYGTVIQDAGEIVPKSELAKHKNSSWAIFADYFRYKLLYEKGGWWVDMDTVCLKPFEFDEEYIFSSEKSFDGKTYINNTMIKCPMHSKIMEGCLNNFDLKEIRDVQWGDTGPKLIAKNISERNLEKYVKSFNVFCPIPYTDMNLFIKPTNIKITDDSYSIHFWNELWRRNRLDKNDIYNKDSIYEKLKRKYLPGYKQIFSPDFSDLTFIIPVRIDSDDRKNNLNLVLSFLLKHFNSPIKIIEADKESKIVIKETSSLISACKKTFN